MTPSEAKMDFNDRPFIAIWEVTQACDLACLHCRACAKPLRHPLELSTSEGEDLIDQIAALRVPVFVLTGGDPLKRPDLFRLVEYATARGVRTSLTPSATPLLTREALVELKRRGLARLAVSLDGSTAAIHDGFRGVAGSFALTLDVLRWAREVGLPSQINTTVCRPNLANFDEVAKLVEALKPALWSVFFLVPTGRGRTADLLTAEEFEGVFAKLYGFSRRAPFDIKTTEAQHYRRFYAQARARERRNATPLEAPVAAVDSFAGDGIGRAPRGLNDAKGFVFISHTGEVFPSGFLPISAGNIRQQTLAEIYRHSPLFTALRDPSRLKGKCGVCEFREICGGSRARAYALTGDPLSEEPCCVYQPRTCGSPEPSSLAGSS
jgi:radical SAM protein